MDVNNLKTLVFIPNKQNADLTLKQATAINWSLKPHDDRVDLYHHKDLSVPEEIPEEWEYIYWLLNPYRKIHYKPGNVFHGIRNIGGSYGQKRVSGTGRHSGKMLVSKGLVGPGREWKWTGTESVEEIVRRWKEVPESLKKEQGVLEGYGSGWRNWRDAGGAVYC